MDGLELHILRRRLDVIESILMRSGLVDSVIGGRLSPVSDPSPDDPGRGGGWGWGGGFGGWHIPRPGDPPVWDIARLNKAQLQSVVHGIAAERTRLDAMEKAVKEQMERA